MESLALDSLVELRPLVVEEILRSMPQVASRGERARFFCEQDVAHTLEHLTVAVVLDAPHLFRAYARWLQGVLVARDVGAECLPQSLEVLRRACVSLSDSIVRHRVLSTIDEAMASLMTPDESGSCGPEDDVAHYVSVAVAGRRAEVLAIVGRWIAEGGAVGALRRLAAAQHEIGERWQRNEISVAEEHRATALAYVALSLLVPFTAGAPGERARGRAIVACAPGDWHAVGPRIAADLLEIQGYEVDFLGANTPVAELVRMVEDVRPVLVGIGVAPITALPAACEAISAVRQAHNRCRVVAGGRAARLAGAGALGCDAVAPAEFDGPLP